MKRLGRHHAHTLQSGFSLIEVLCAFTILVVALGLLLEGFSQSVHATKRADQYTQAVLHAQSKLSELSHGTASQVGEHEGMISDHFQWRSSVTEYVWVPSVDRQLGVIAFTVSVEISWLDGARRRAVTLKTLMLTPASA